MSGETPSNSPVEAEQFRYRSWYHDPEQVENLVVMLEEQTSSPEDKSPPWKYGTGHAYRVMFIPLGESPETKYANAPIPTLGSFAATTSYLASGKYSFGPEVPSEVVERFLSVMKKRGGLGVSHWGERAAFWDDHKKLVVAGLVDYCRLTAEHAATILENKLGHEVKPQSIYTMLSDARTSKEFPYEHASVLPRNNPLAITFVGTLKAMTGMSLEDVRMWAEKNNPNKTRLEELDTFIENVEKYRLRLEKTGDVDVR